MQDQPADGQQQKAQEIVNALIPEDQWPVYANIITAAQMQKLGFALGGGLASSIYSGHLRSTKDMDLFILPEDHEALLAIMREQGFEDYYERSPYDRRWSFRGYRKGLIIDVLWKLLNDRTEVDERWIINGWKIDVAGTRFRLIPLEELIWSKLYIMQRERCDWPDIITLLYTRGQDVDWHHLLARLGEDANALGGLMSLFRWMCPGPANKLPNWIWNQMGLCPMEFPTDSKLQEQRAALFNAENWFPRDGD